MCPKHTACERIRVKETKCPSPTLSFLYSVKQNGQNGFSHYLPCTLDSTALQTNLGEFCKKHQQFSQRNSPFSTFFVAVKNVTLFEKGFLYNVFTSLFCFSFLSFFISFFSLLCRYWVSCFVFFISRCLFEVNCVRVQVLEYNIHSACSYGNC